MRENLKKIISSKVAKIIVRLVAVVLLISMCFIVLGNFISRKEIIMICCVLCIIAMIIGFIVALFKE